MGENREYLAHAEDNGTINISEEVVAAIALDAMKEIDGVGSMSQGEQLTGKKAARGVHLDVQGDSMEIDLYLMVRYGYAIPEVAQKVQESVAAAVSGMTGFAVSAVNVHVGGISFNDEKEKRN